MTLQARGRPRHARPTRAADAEGTPATAFPEPARRILRAARRILRKRGFSELTLQAVAEEAGMRKPAISYYFGNKAGLVAAIVDNVNRTQLERYEREVQPLGDDAARVDAYVALGKRLALTGGIEFLEILPAVTRVPEIRMRIAELYDRYRDLNVSNLAYGLDEAAAARFKPLAALTSAVLDGVSIQAALRIDESILMGMLDEWERIVRQARSDALTNTTDGHCQAE